MTTRRAFIGTVAGGLLATPLAAGAQPAARIPRIGYLAPSVSPEASRLIGAFRQGLRELGYVEGQTIVLEERWAEGTLDRLPNLVTELVQLKVDLIVVSGGVTIAPAKQATSTIPIVMTFSFDAVELGYVASLAHPGGNVTGLTTMTSDLNQKRLEILKETVPGSARMTALACKGMGGQGWEEMQVTARALGVQLQLLEVREPDDYEGAFATAISERAEAMVVFRCYFNVFNQQRIVDLAAKHRLPAIYDGRG